jgi:hypothetical protein
VASSTLGGNPCDTVGLPGWLFAGQPSRQDAVCDFFSNTAAPAASIRPYEALSAVWKYYAERYADNSTVVGADLYNEPYVVDACPDMLVRQLPGFYLAVGSSVRRTNARIALIMEDVAYQGYQKAGLQLRELPTLPNVIYSWHFYPNSWAEGELSSKHTWHTLERSACRYGWANSAHLEQPAMPSRSLLTPIGRSISLP